MRRAILPLFLLALAACEDTPDATDCADAPAGYVCQEDYAELLDRVEALEAGAVEMGERVGEVSAEVEGLEAPAVEYEAVVTHRCGIDGGDEDDPATYAAYLDYQIDVDDPPRAYVRYDSNPDYVELFESIPAWLNVSSHSLTQSVSTDRDGFVMAYCTYADYSSYGGPADYTTQSVTLYVEVGR